MLPFPWSVWGSPGFITSGSRASGRAVDVVYRPLMYRYCATFCARPASRRGTPRAPACPFCLPAPSHARSAGGLTEALSNIGNCCGPVPCLLLKSNVEEKVEAKELADEFLSEDEDEES